MRLLCVCVFGLALAGCFVPVPEVDGGVVGGGTGGGSATGGGGGGGGGSAGGCTADAQCPSGELCYLCQPKTTGTCLTGCNAGHMCPSGQSCFPLGITCFTCPCPDSECRGATCVDQDGDGYVPGVSCNGKPGGDCDDNARAVNPGAGERCTNGIDDDCDGLIDSADPDCGPPMCTGGTSCTTSWNCGLESASCDQRCCVPCPVYAPPNCAPDSCLLPPSLDPFTGCRAGPGCYPCLNTVCPAVYAPVCASVDPRGMNPRTFSNTCVATSANATVLHAGACLQGEGLNCGSIGAAPGCGPDNELYCRDACPECDADLRRCTKKGTCVTDLDCPAGLPAPGPLTCGGGSIGTLRCEDHACVRRCP